MIGVGFLLGSWRRGRGIGGLILGAGLLFLGLDLTVSSLGDLAGTELFKLVIDAAERQPFVVVLVGVALGGLLGSANAAAAVALGLFAADAVTFPTALAMVAGGNVGSTLLPLLTSRRLDASAQQVATMHLAIKGLGAVALAFLVEPVAQALAFLGGDGARQIANAHTGFNLIVGLLGTLFAGPAARLAARVVPLADDQLGPKYLRDDALGDPQLAIALALRETVRVSDQVAVMTELAAKSLRSGLWDPEPIAAREAKVDHLTQTTVDYLARLRAQHGDDEASERLLLMVTELEHVGDQIRRLQRREDKLRAAGVEYSRDGRAQLGDTADRMLERMRTAFTAAATHDRSMARGVIGGRPTFEAHVAQMRVAHLARLEARLPEARASSSHHLEVLTLLRQVDASVTRVAGWVADAASDAAAPVPAA